MAQEPMDAQAIGRGKKILVVDDDPGFRKFLQTKLSSRGFEAVTAGTGEEGLELAKQVHPDLIILDVLMPSMKGREVCARLKADEATAHIPVVFLTAKDSPDDIKAEIEAGALTHFTKPIDPPTLIDALKKILSL